MGRVGKPHQNRVRRIAQNVFDLDGLHRLVNHAFAEVDFRAIAGTSRR